MGKLTAFRLKVEQATEEFKHQLWSRNIVSEDQPIDVKNSVSKSIAQVGEPLFEIRTTVKLMYSERPIYISVIDRDPLECLRRFNHQFEYWYK